MSYKRQFRELPQKPLPNNKICDHANTIIKNGRMVYERKLKYKVINHMHTKDLVTHKHFFG